MGYSFLAINFKPETSRTERILKNLGSPWGHYPTPTLVRNGFVNSVAEKNYRPGDNIQPEDVNWEQDLERLEQAASGVEPELLAKSLKNPCTTSTSRPSAFGGEGRQTTFETVSRDDTRVSSKPGEEAGKSRTAIAQFTAIERRNASRASMR